MVAMSLDNVIPFPDGGRGTASALALPPLLRECRELMGQKLRETLRGWLPILEEDLLTRGDLADSAERRSFFYGGRQILHEQAGRLDGMLAAQWQKCFDDALHRRKEKSGGELFELELVALGDMDEDLAVNAIAGRLRDRCEEGLFGAGRRLTFLAGQGEEVPALEQIFSRALRGCVMEAGFPAALRLEMLRWFALHGTDGLSGIVHELNSFLVGRQVLPKLRRSFDRPAVGKAGAAAPRPKTLDEAGDLFALLQRLVGPPSSGFGVAGPGAFTGATGGGLPGSVNGSLVSVAMAMEQVMTSLDVLQRVMPPAGQFAISANLLREFRSSATGQNLGHLDAITVDIVATLFDFIFDDEAIADPIKALIGRLQIPVLKVAMLDKSFFSSRAHPARRLLDGISRAAVRCGPQAGHGDPLYAHVNGIIARLQAEFTQDTALFDLLRVDLDNFLDGQEALADERAAKAAPLVAAQERRELAAVAAEQALAGWLMLPLPTAVIDLLNTEWRTLLTRHYLAADDAAWSAAVGTVSDLVASVQPQPDVRARKLLATKLPTLVKRIHDSLDFLQVPADRRLVVIDALFTLHAAVLRGATPVVTTNWPVAPQAVEPEITREQCGNDETMLESITLAEPAPPALAGDVRTRVDELRRGDWLEFLRGEAGLLRYRLSWISPERGILLFTSPHLPRALSVTPAALAVQIERGEASILSAEPIFDRAVNRALESLQAA